MASYLELEAALGTPCVHPGGANATAHLWTRLRLTAGDRALDVGCGTGATAREAAARGVSVAAFERMPAMLAAARRRTLPPGAPPVWLVRGDIAAGLPFADGCFDAAWAESVLALVKVRPALAECVRTIRPGGRLVLNERIWRSGVSAGEAERINRLSRRCFGIPAATEKPIDDAGWVALLTAAGARVIERVLVDDLSPAPVQRMSAGTWLARQIGYLSPPMRLVRSLRWRWLARRHRTAWTRLESWIFVAEKPR